LSLYRCTAVPLDTGEGVGKHSPVESEVVLCGKFRQPVGAVAGLEQSVDVHGVADLCAAEEGAGLACGQVVRVQHRAEVGVDRRMVQELGGQLHLAEGAGVRSVMFNRV
jgi:hypothetical protein